MQVRTMPRGGGKTTEALRKLKSYSDAQLVCATHNEATRLRDLIRGEMESSIEGADEQTAMRLRALAEDRMERIVSVSDVVALRGGYQGPVLFDNLEWILENLLGIAGRDLWASLTPSK